MCVGCLHLCHSATKADRIGITQSFGCKMLLSLPSYSTHLPQTFILFPLGISRECVVACLTCLDFPAIWICSLTLFNSTALFPDKFDLCRDSAICQLISTFHALHVSPLISSFLGTFLDANGSGKSEQFIFAMVVQHLPTLSNEMWKCVWSSSILGSLKGRGRV